jgi:hypothetical protein
MRHDIALVMLMLGLLGQVALLGANAFEAVVDVPNWRTPDGLRAYRAFTHHRNAGHFYRVVSPLTILALAGALALGWSALGQRDLLVGASLLAAVGAEVMTIVYFFPRNRQLFFAATEPAAESASALVDQWSRANLARVGLVLAGAVCGLLGLYASGTGGLPW